MRRGLAAAAACGLLVAGACSDGGDDGPAAPDPVALEGAWDVNLVVGFADTAPGADAAFPLDATYRERWVFEGCDADGCTLRRPDGGFIFGDLDAVPIGLGAGLGLDEDDELRLVGEGEADFPPPPDLDEATACDGAPTEHWSVRVELGVADGVLSGSAFRTPEVLETEVAGVTCYGYDLTLGLSGTPAR